MPVRSIKEAEASKDEAQSGYDGGDDTVDDLTMTRVLLTKLRMMPLLLIIMVMMTCSLTGYM